MPWLGLKELSHCPYTPPLLVTFCLLPPASPGIYTKGIYTLSTSPSSWVKTSLSPQLSSELVTCL